MIISEQLRRTNIAEYILYMWQTEDMVRSLDFDLKKIQEQIIDKYDVEEEIKEKILNWYSGLIQMTNLENIKQSGHLQVVTNIVNDLNDLHLWLLNQPAEIQYKKIHETTLPHIKALSEKMQGKALNQIDICLHGLYAIMLLKLQNKEITADTANAIETFRQIIALLASKYHDREDNPDKYYQ
ncbi:MAG: DUF4924 family protein [Bacteroidales bacterium]|nr:DUF4924 family protein [Bacteroidales bacterium]